MAETLTVLAALIRLQRTLGLGPSFSGRRMAPALLLLAALSASTAAPLTPPAGLQLNLLAPPVRGVDRIESVSFAWKLPASRGVAQQAAAQVVVNETDRGGTTHMVLDTGKIATGQPEHVAAMAAVLRSDASYTWAVRVWGVAGTGTVTAERSPFSAAAAFTTGLLNRSDWTAKWIRGGTQLRKEFTITQPVSRASLFVSACQYYEISLDGLILGDQVLDSPWTNFYTNRSYTSHDITPHLLQPGKHVLGLRVGQGFCTSASHDQWDPNAERSAIVQLQLHGTGPEDQPFQRVVTDETWTGSDGPIRQDSTYYGELYDARKETPGWDRPGFVPAAGSVWKQASTNFTVVAQLSSQAMPPIKRVKEINALTMTKVMISADNGTCGANLAGSSQKPVSLSCAGSTIKSVGFFSYGVPGGDCKKGLTKGNCSSLPTLTESISRVCVGHESCSVACHGKGCTVPSCHGDCSVSTGSGPAKLFTLADPCVGTEKTISMEVTCTVTPPPSIVQQYKYVYDFGQEFAGVVRVTLPPNMPRGANVTLKHAEALAHEPLATQDGSVYMGNLFWANPVDVYLTKGSSTSEVYEPSFTYHGFRYVEMTITGGGALPAEPTVDSVVGINMRTAVTESATLRFGADPHSPGNIIQKLSNNSWWTEAAALMSIPAGAAGRGERNGWTGDAAFGSESECFDFDTGAFFSRYLEQVSDTCGQHGEIGAGVPNQGTTPNGLHMTTGLIDPSWAAVFPVVAYNIWKYHNATPALEYAWPWLQKYMYRLEANYSVSTSTYARWGDWNPAYPAPGRNPQGQGLPFTRTVSHITGAAMVVQNHIEYAEMARVLGKVRLSIDRANIDQYLLISLLILH